MHLNINLLNIFFISIIHGDLMSEILIKGYKMTIDTRVLLYMDIPPLLYFTP